jgi:TonB-linked SusC/RagA family outer membrane protein
MRKVMTLLCFLISISWAFSQTRVTGKVLSGENGDPIIGATILVKGTNTGTITDTEGKFSLTVPAGAKELRISYVGMTAKEVPVKPVMEVVLQPANQDLGEVMVVAYGTSNKRSFTGSAQEVKSEDLTKRLVANVTKALDGQVAGVQTTSGSGQPGSGAAIIIRGFGSINASNTPLYVVDGIPYDGNINAINPEDIESITLLKDASAASLFGSRAANGVVMITLKKGKQEGDKVMVSLRTTVGVNSRAIPQYKTMNQAQYLETAFQAFKNDQIYNKGIDPNLAGAAALAAMSGPTQGILGVNEQYNPYNMPLAQLIDPNTGLINPAAQLRYDENWMKEITATNPLRQDYQLSFNGGSKRTQYTASLGYLKDDGLLKTTGFQRYTGRLNVETQAKDWLKYGMGFNYAKNNSKLDYADYSSGSTTATSNVWYSAQLMAPIYPIYQLDANGQPMVDGSGAKIFDYGLSRPAGAQNNFNSIATLYNDKYGSYSDNLDARAFLEISGKGALKGLKLRSNLGFDDVNAYSMYYYNPYFGNAAPAGGRLQKDNGRTFSYTFNQLLTYEKKFLLHGIDALAGHESYALRYNYLMAQKTGFPFGGLYELAAGSVLADGTSYEDNYRMESWFGRLNYNYAERYYLSGSIRTDGSSRFASDHRWGTFWSVGASWRISTENFLNKINWIDNITLKASYGTQGNDRIGSYYAWQAFYDLGWPNASAPGAAVSSLENRSLTWESNQNANFGVEFKLFNRFSGTIEYYTRKTVDMLLSKPMATSLGFDGYNANVGSMRNSGLEVTLSGDIIRNRNFGWTLTLIGQTLKNKVLKLADKPEIVYANQIIREGETLYSFYVVHSAGVDPATGKLLYKYFKKDANGIKIPGSDYISSDVSLAPQNRVLSGSRIPTLQGSINNAFRLSGFDFSFMITYSIGGKILDNMYQTLMQPMYIGQNYHINDLRAWKKPGDITDVPKMMLNPDYAITDRNLINASYLSFKNVSLGYTFKRSLMKKIGIESLRLFATVENLYLFSHLQGMNPQYNFTGTTDYVYSPNRTVAGGLDVNF